MKKTMANWNLFRIVYPKDGYGSEEVYLADSQGEVLSNYDNSPGTITLGKDLLGNWTTTFKIESVKDIKTVKQTIELDTWTVDKIFFAQLVDRNFAGLSILVKLI